MRCLKSVLPLGGCNEAVTGFGYFAAYCGAAGEGYFQSPGGKGEEKGSTGYAWEPEL